MRNAGMPQSFLHARLRLYGDLLGSAFEFQRLVAASQAVIWFASPGSFRRAVTFFQNFDFQSAGFAGPDLVQFQIDAA